MRISSKIKLGCAFGASFFLSSCALPMRVGDARVDGAYNLVMEALICEAIFAWRYERIKYGLDDSQRGKSWKVSIIIEQSKTHSAGFKIGLGGRDTPVRWTIMPGADTSPTSNLLHQATAKVDVNIPGTPATARGSQELVDTELDCEDGKNVINLHPMKISSYFKNYIDGFNETKNLLQTTNKGIVTNFKYENTANFSISASPNFSYALQPYSLSLGPSLSYGDKIFIQMLVTRFTEQTEEERTKAYNKLIREEAKRRVAIEDEVARIRRARGDKSVMFRSGDSPAKLVSPRPEFPREEFSITPDPFSQESDEFLRRAIRNLPPN